MTTAPPAGSPGRTKRAAMGVPASEYLQAVPRWSRPRSFAALAVLVLVFATVQVVALAAPARAAAAVGFGKSVLAGASTKTRATSVQFGPDGRLYVLHQDGTINIYGIQRNGPDDYVVTSKTSTALVKNIPNHSDTGALVTTLNNSYCTAPCRTATGMLVTG